MFVFEGHDEFLGLIPQTILIQHYVSLRILLKQLVVNQTHLLRVFKVDAKIRNALPIYIRSFAVNWKASSKNWKSSENRKVYSEDAEGFFCRALALYVPKSPKNGAALLTHLLEIVYAFCSCA